MVHSRWFSLPLLACLVTFSGCASFSSVLLHRGEDNAGWEKERALRGVPVTLEVPTHVRIDLIEKHFLVLQTQGEGDAQIQRVTRLETRFPVRQVSYSFIKEKKIFVVDMKRPGAGTLTSNLTFDSEKQYFTNIQNQVTDETITAIGNLISTIAPQGLIGAPTTGEAGKNIRGSVKEVSSVAASEIFEIDAPDFEHQIRAFLDQHLNCCHDCRQLPWGAQPPTVLPQIHEPLPLVQPNVLPTPEPTSGETSLMDEVSGTLRKKVFPKVSQRLR